GDVFYVAAGPSLIRLKNNGTIDDSFGYKGKIVIDNINFVNHKGFQEYYVGTSLMFTDIRSILYYKGVIYITFFIILYIVMLNIMKKLINHLFLLLRLSRFYYWRKMYLLSK
ncbi:MAG: hypothetical protein RMJ36_04400, partial [Candidatus Calescibacterium sp.]|nr:hypothetical protein [Candidatus Calescibacterium sp.]MDW8132876.1 hypothetical protein [Candidatus Calescibacterium sp.]